MSWRVDFNRLQYTEESNSTFSIAFTGGDVSQFQNQLYYSSLRFGIATGHGFASASSGDIDLFGRQSIGTERDPVSNVLYDIYEIPVSRGLDETGIRWRNIDDAVEEIENFQVKIFGVSLTRVSTGTETYVGPSLTTSSGTVWQFVDPSNSTRTVQIVDDEGGADNFTDLMITNFAVSGSGSSGTSVTASFSLFNLGSKQVGGGATGHVRFLDEAGRLLQDTPFTTSTLQPNGAAGIISPASFSYLVPLGFDGDITVEVAVDSDEDETVLSNNRQAQTIGFTQNDPLADLTAEEIVFVPDDLSISEGDTGFVRFRVSNLSDEVASEGSTANVVVRDPSGAVVFSRENITVLSVTPNGGQLKQTSSFTLPAGVVGAFSISVEVNASGSVPEGVTVNNVVTQTFSVSDQEAARALGEFLQPQRVADGVYEIDVATDVLNNDIPGDAPALSADRITDVRVDEGQASVEFDAADGVFRVRLDDPNDAQTLLRYTIDDGFGGTSSANVRLAYQGTLPVNAAPTPTPDTVVFERLSETGNYSVLASRILGNDTDPDGDPLRLVSIETDGSFQASLADGGIVIETAPETGTAGTLTYVVADPSGATAQSTVTLSFPQAEPVDPEAPPDTTPTTNAAPVVQVLSPVSVNINTPISIAELIDAYDPDGHIAEVIVADPGQGGAFLESLQGATDQATIHTTLTQLQSVFVNSGETAGFYDINLRVADNNGALSDTATVTLDVRAPVSAADSAPRLGFDLAASYTPYTDLRLDDLVTFSDPDGQSDIKHVMLGDFSEPGASAGFLFNRESGDVLRATSGGTALRQIEISEFSDWFFRTSDLDGAAQTTDKLLVVPIDASGLTPTEHPIMPDDIDANITLNVRALPQVDLLEDDGYFAGTAGNTVPLSLLVSANASTTHIRVTLDGLQVELLRNGVVQAGDSVDVPVAELADWSLRLLSPDVGQSPSSGEVQFAALDGTVQGGSKQLVLSVHDATEPDAGLPDFDLLEMATNMLRTGIGFVQNGLDEFLAHMQELYDNGTKYVFTTAIGLSGPVGPFFGKVQSKISIDLADVLNLTVEGRGGYDGNEAGKVTVWRTFKEEFGVLAPLAGAKPSLSFSLTPVSIKDKAPDDRSKNEFALETESKLPVGFIEVGASQTLDADGPSTAINFGVPFLNMEFDDDDLRAYEPGQNLTPKITAEFDLTPSLGAKAFISREDTFALGEYSKDMGLVGLSLLATVGAIPFADLLLTEPDHFSPITAFDGFTGNRDANDIDGSNANDEMEGSGGNDTLRGLGGNDVLLGGTGFDELDGGPGEDILKAGSGGGLMIGGEGADSYVVKREHLSGQKREVEIWDKGQSNEADQILLTETIGADRWGPLASRPEFAYIDEASLVFSDIGSDLQVEIYVLRSGLLNTALGNREKIGEIWLRDQASAESRVESIKIVRVIEDDLSVVSEIDLVARAEEAGWFQNATSINQVPTEASGQIGTSLVGISGPDAFSGTDLAERFETGAGDDLVFAGGGDDTIVGGSGEGDDYYSGGPGTDKLIYTSATAGLVIDLERGTVSGDPTIGNDRIGLIENITAGTFDDDIRGDAMANRLDGQGGADRILGQDGNDTLLGGAGDDMVSGGAGDDMLDGGTDNDTVNGDEGDDHLISTAGANVLNGGLGDDLITTDQRHTHDTIDGGAGTDTVVISETGRALRSAVDMTAPIQSDLGGAGALSNVEAVHWVGGQFDDTVTFRFDPETAASHEFAGAGGLDRLLLPDVDATDATLGYDAQSGVQTLSLGATQIRLTGVEVITFGAQDADQTVWLDGRELGALGSDQVLFENGSQTVYLRDPELLVGEFTIGGGTGEDRLIVDWSPVTEVIRNIALMSDGFIAGIGNSRLGVQGFESLDLSAGAGSTTVYASNLNGGNRLLGGPLDDTLSSGLGADEISGGDGDDNLTSTGGDDTILGGAGADWISVGLGETLARGGLGADSISADDPGLHILHGEQGNDRFSIGTNAGTVHVYGGAGQDHLSYRAAAEAAPLNLQFGADPDAIHALPQGGSFRGIEDLTLHLAGGDDTLALIVQPDSRHIIYGGDGIDAVSMDYSVAAAAIDVFYQTTASRTSIDVGEDFSALLYQIETLNIVGSEFGDSFRTWAPDVQMRLYGGNGDDTFFGSDLGDEISGGGDDDFVNGRSGDDLLRGDGGDDQLRGEEGDDTLEGGAGDDSIYGEQGHDRLLGEGGQDWLFAGDGNDTVFGGDGDDYLDAESGTNILEGGSGNDSIYGGTGFDTAVYDLNLADISVSEWFGGLIITSALGVDTIHNSVESFRFADGTASYDDLVALIPAAPLNIYGTDAADTLTGDTEDDTLDGADGDDSLYGLEGNDLLLGGQDDDLLNGGPGDDWMLGEDGDDTLEGGDGDDYLDAESGTNILEGGSGNDSIYGGTGFDTAVYDLNLADISVSEWFGGLIITSALGVDTIHNSVESFRFADGTASYDDLVALIPAAPLNIYGTDAADTLTGDTEDDTLDGADGDDSLYGLEGNDLLLGGQNDDLLKGGPGDDSMLGEDGNDTLNGGHGDDNIVGGAGDDMIWGGAGGDTLLDGIDADYLRGGPGNDTIVLSGTKYHTAQYAAYNVTSATQTGTGQRINLDGKVKIEAVIDGGADVDTIDLSSQGDAFFLHDAYSRFHHSLTLSEDDVGNESTQRFINVQNINGLGGDDIIDLTSPDYSLAGETIRIDGGQGHDVIWGSDANETIHGGIGNDTIFGGVGTDLLFGGAGADTFQFTRTSTDTTVEDFDPTAGDTLEFFNNGGAAFYPTSLALTDTGVRVAYEEAGTRYEIDIALAASADEFSWSLSQISAATDFI